MWIYELIDHSHQVLPRPVVDLGVAHACAIEPATPAVTLLAHCMWRALAPAPGRCLLLGAPADPALADALREAAAAAAAAAYGGGIAPAFALGLRTRAQVQVRLVEDVSWPWTLQLPSPLSELWCAVACGAGRADLTRS